MLTQKTSKRIVRQGAKLTLFANGSTQGYHVDTSAADAVATDDTLTLINAELRQITNILKRFVMRADDEIARTENVARQLRGCRMMVEDANAFSRARYALKDGISLWP